ncbi:type II toxin-antitoxin system RelE/ParE family toxin [Candidatus Saccharibacteria bacterium]|nr:type II toxin-antitoxin system RelE/ParE family toxin [Candidatus Saccharibacteria bacterium]MBQ9016794.1 type II toxin-antitoxin system RelE/ParE family toxin [Candidatus Saccharibacteria bacterium]
MPKRYRVVILDRAERDIENAFGYIYFELSNPIAAYNTYDGIISKIKSLSIFPAGYDSLEIGPWRGKGYRKIHYKNYTIIYKIHEDDNLVVVTNITYSHRNFSNLQP